MTGQDLRAGLYAEVAPTLEATAGRSRGAGTPLGMLAPPVIASDGKRGKSRHEGAALVEAWGGNNTSGPIDVATAVRAHPGPNGHQDFESETFVTAYACQGSNVGEAGTLRAGNGGVTGGVPFVSDPITAREGDSYTHEGKGNFRLRNVVAFTVKDHGADAGDDVALTLRAMEHQGGNANAGGQIGVATGARLRRLTPRECERLQGLPDNYTAVPWRGRRVAKDGPRYRAIGNGMAIPVMRWILTRLRREHER